MNSDLTDDVSTCDICCSAIDPFIADHMTQTGNRIKWDHFHILATGQSEIHCKIRETLKPTVKKSGNLGRGWTRVQLWDRLGTQAHLFPRAPQTIP